MTVAFSVIYMFANKKMVDIFAMYYDSYHLPEHLKLNAEIWFEHIKI